MSPARTACRCRACRSRAWPCRLYPSIRSRSKSIIPRHRFRSSTVDQRSTAGPRVATGSERNWLGMALERVRQDSPTTTRVATISTSKSSRRPQAELLSLSFASPASLAVNGFSKHSHHQILLPDLGPRRQFRRRPVIPDLALLDDVHPIGKLGRKAQILFRDEHRRTGILEGLQPLQ